MGLAGEVEDASVGGREIAGEGVAKGIAGIRLVVLGEAHVSANNTQAFCTKPVGMIEGGAAFIGDEVATASEDFIVALVDATNRIHGDVAGKIANIEDGAGGTAFIRSVGSFLDALAEPVVDVRGSGTGGVAVGDEAILGVVG